MFLGALARRSALAATIHTVEPCRESVAESLTAGHLHLSGLPMPTFQTPVRTERGTYYLDMYWPEMGLVGECDGAVKYTDPQAYVNEKKREQVLRDLGYRIVRWLAAEIMTRPDIVLDRIARALTLSRGLSPLWRTSSASRTTPADFFEFWAVRGGPQVEEVRGLELWDSRAS
jgi:very-short-patch-repair endonuclease